MSYWTEQITTKLGTVTLRVVTSSFSDCGMAALIFLRRGRKFLSSECHILSCRPLLLPAQLFAQAERGLHDMYIPLHTP